MTHPAKFTLGVVGHGQEKFTVRTEWLAREAIHEAALRHGATAISSGHSPMGGVDLYAEDVANELALDTDGLIFEPTVHVWNGAGGFRARNLKIAAVSNLVLCVVVQKLPPHFDGMKFDRCYHCQGRNPDHVKSGGCWTAWRCARGHEWKIIE